MNPSAHQSLRDDKDGTREYSSRPEALNLASRTGRIYDSNLSLHQCPEPCKRGGDHIRIHGGSWAPRPNLPKVPAAQQSSEERLSVSDNPGHWNLPSERVCVLPFRDPGEQDVRQGAYRDVFTAFPEGQNTDSRPRMESPHFRCRDAIRAPVRQVSGIPPGASLPFAGRARSHSR